MSKTTQKKYSLVVVLLSLLVTQLLIGLYAFAQEEPLLPEEMRDKVQLLSTMPMLMAAESLGITEIADKDITTGGSAPGHAKAMKLKDVGIGVHPTKHENEPVVAANPKDKNKLVAGSHFFGPPAPFANRCIAYTSSDGGASWSAPVVMPQLGGSCSDPVLVYAPDGSRIYYAYMDIKPDDFDILVSFSNDNGQTWNRPFVALNGVVGSHVYDKPWIATPLDQSNFVYVTATRFDTVFPFDCHINFTQSSNAGVAYGLPTTLDSGAGGCGIQVVQGSRPSGGSGGEVLVAWYNSGNDGWLNGSFEIRTARSGDNGISFDLPVIAALDSFEAPFWLGPSAFYHRWWGTMFPDVEIDPGGKAHIVYTHDPAENPFPGFPDTPEDGDIRYISSAQPPYDAWSAPVTINDDGLVRAQGYAALEIQQGGQSSTLHVIWEDHRLSLDVPASTPFDCFVNGVCNSPNLFYDIFYSSLGATAGIGWFKNLRVSDTSSIVDGIFIGDYNDLTANNTLLFAIWTDRRDKTSIFDFEDDVFGSRIIAGGGTPATP